MLLVLIPREEIIPLVLNINFKQIKDLNQLCQSFELWQSFFCFYKENLLQN